MDDQSLKNAAPAFIEKCSSDQAPPLLANIHVLPLGETLKAVDKSVGKIKSGNGWINLLEEEFYRLIARTKQEFGYFRAIFDVGNVREEVVSQVGQHIGIKIPESSTALYVYAGILVIYEFLADEPNSISAVIHTAVLHGYRPIAWQGEIESGRLICSQN